MGLIERKLALCEDPYQKEILLYLSSAFFVELVAAISQQTVISNEDMRTLVNRPDFIFKRFMETMAADSGRHRTSKYLSRIIKRISGKNALTLIHENAIEHIIRELKHSSKSIKEIAADFEFSNVSFFAQYVKKHLGVTPSEFRSNVKADKEVSAS